MSANKPWPSMHFVSITTVSVAAAMQTNKMFDKNHPDSDLSPIDQFITNTNKLNLMYSSSQDLSAELSQLIILGYMSAIESYFRTVFRSVINIDPIAQQCVEERSLSYGAAIHHKKKLLPDALLEDISFASRKNIVEALRDLLGVGGALPDAVLDMLKEYDAICQMRHCCIHRFGRLGSRNAIRLGLTSHAAILEKPLKLDKPMLELVAFKLRNTAKAINNHLYDYLMKRISLPEQGSPAKPFTWNYKMDKKRFLSYYNIFKTESDSDKSPTAEDIYNTIKKRVEETNAQKAAKHGTRLPNLKNAKLPATPPAV